MALPSLEETSSFPQSSFPPSETSPRFMMMDVLIERPRKWQQDGGCTDGQTVDESIHRSEGGYGWGREAMRAQLSLSLTAGMRKGSFSKQASFRPPVFYLSLDRSHYGFSSRSTFLCHPRHRQLSCHSCRGGRRGDSVEHLAFLP